MTTSASERAASHFRYAPHVIRASILSDVIHDVAMRVKDFEHRKLQVYVKKHVFDSDALGMPEPGKTYVDAPVHGLAVLAIYGEGATQSFKYHTDNWKTLRFVANPVHWRKS